MRPETEVSISDPGVAWLSKNLLRSGWAPRSRARRDGNGREQRYQETPQ
jgi:hypothetical protein